MLSPEVGLLVLGLFILAVVVYTGFKIRQLQKRSEEQWRQVDHSKLREWNDDDD
ncbi:MAG: hypothetical protein AAFZ58_10775 [Pseudomonadota bacterium]